MTAFKENIALQMPCFTYERPRCTQSAHLFTGHLHPRPYVPCIEDAWMIPEKRNAGRVTFERGFPVWLMAIDGTWRRNCRMMDVSETGARLIVESSIEGINLKEFFLLLSSTGLAFRRCELAWVNGEEIGATFLRQGPKKKPDRKVEAEV
jgi:hypothetical protein